eukprot:353299-Chlamydomonas_euryale.AAC.19
MNDPPVLVLQQGRHQLCLLSPRRQPNRLAQLPNLSDRHHVELLFRHPRGASGAAVGAAHGHRVAAPEQQRRQGARESNHVQLTHAGGDVAHESAHARGQWRPRRRWNAARSQRRRWMPCTRE